MIGDSSRIPDLLIALGWVFDAAGASPDLYTLHKGWLDVVRLTTPSESWFPRESAEGALHRDPVTRSALETLRASRAGAYRRPVPAEVLHEIVWDCYSRVARVAWELPAERKAEPRRIDRRKPSSPYRGAEPSLRSDAVAFEWNAPFQSLAFCGSSLGKEELGRLLSDPSAWGRTRALVPVALFEPVLYSGVAANPFQAVDFDPIQTDPRVSPGKIRWDLMENLARQSVADLGGALMSGLDRDLRPRVGRYLRKLERLALYLDTGVIVSPEEAVEDLFFDVFPTEGWLREVSELSRRPASALHIFRRAYFRSLPRLIALHRRCGARAGG